MLKAVVFDDEHIVLQGLKTMVDWESFGIELAGTAENGTSALRLFRDVRPDLLLTDIRMPGMDGLQLIEAALAEAPETYCIVFSGFNEFDYVKRAIQLGVADYLEKPITVPSIERAIGKAVGRINEQKETTSYKRRWEDGKRELLEKSTSDLLLLGEDEKWREPFGPQADHVVGVTVLAYCGEFQVPEQPEYRTVYVRVGEERFAVVFHFIDPGHAFWERLAQEDEREDIAVGAGRTYADPAQAVFSFSEAKRALRSACFLDASGLLRFEELGELITSPEGLTEREEAMILSMRAGNIAGVMEQVDRFLAWLQSEKVGPDVAEREMVKLLYFAMEASKEGEAAEGGEPFLPHVEIREALTRGRVHEWFRERMERIAASSSERRETTKHAAVDRAMSFIDRNLSRDLSLEEVAGHVGMNASYFSVLFKEVMGETYIKYVTRSRMELAKRMLGQGLKVNEVSERVGYRAYRHFSEVFKRYAGTTPGQYKEGGGDPK
ncbi:response regulator [Paenibacillus antri]|uniref:Response regulator n=1 Tax=Paenibacillus antri TaxID=2582848 RepID=A0A5R9G7Q3_9BACL|nr:response regulator [Paenibacillus antri]TLS48773.1 response regulator [Paenibacillus antri]